MERRRAAVDGAGGSVRERVLGSLDWRLIGPHRGGRVVAVAGDPSRQLVFYFGACAGGVWKTVDGGISWRNVSDGFFGTAAVGALAVAPSDPNVLYAGTGETTIRGNVSHGDGVYKSTDAGQTWTNVGLRDTRHIGKIRVHPNDPNLVYVAALGHAFGPNADRGIFRSRDGGGTWERILHKSDRAGCHDLSMDATNPRLLYAPVWQAQRYPHALVNGGPESGLWRSRDGGDSWEEITRKPGLPKGVLGKIGVAASPAKEGRVWALIEAEDGALFRSDDGGETWDRLCEESFLRTRPWYYMHVFADPRDPETCYVLNYRFWKSTDGGRTFDRIPNPHGDDHDLWLDPADPDRLIQGHDGGACVSFDGGRSWSRVGNQPTAQLYHVTTDNRFPFRVYGSQQDNTAISLPSLSLNGAIHEREWFAPGGGESGYITIKPDDPDVVVASGPIGRRAFNDVMSCYDGRTGQARNVTVWPELYGWGAGAESLKERFQWTFPIFWSPHDPNLLYVAGNRVHRSFDRGGSFEAISPDLTRNDPTKLGPSGGPITRDNTGAEVYCTIFALVESPLRQGLLWAGTDDGLVHLSHDGGRTWREVTPPDLPEWALISVVEASPHEPGFAYVAATCYKLDDTRPYLYKTSDFGESWTRIVDGIREDDFTRVVREDPARRGLLYAGTETGLYASFDDGARWHRLGGTLPVAPIYDLTVKDGSLVVATHGRSFWILDDLSPLRDLADPGEPAATAPHLFPPPPTVRLRYEDGPGWEPREGYTNYGHAGTSVYAYDVVRDEEGKQRFRPLDAGENPPRGVVVQYYLPEAPDGGVRLSFHAEDGTLLREFDSGEGDPEAEVERPSARAGLNHFCWNLRLPGVLRVEGEGLVPWHRDDGPLVLPGRYEARLAVGEATLTQPFELLPDPRHPAPPEALREQFDFLVEIRDRLAETNGLINRVEAARAQTAGLLRRADAAADVAPVKEAAEALAACLLEVETALIDVNMRQAQLWPSGLHEKLNALFDAVDSVDAAPTRQTREVFALLGEHLDGVKRRLGGEVTEKIADLEGRVAAAWLPLVDPPVG
ncbi:MAG: glycosyl hydrolase [Chloroflexota bacterium]|nr:glycosyl hydrolase [Chloroflexota bacterium]